MNDNISLLQKTAELAKDLSPKQLILARYLENNYMNLAYTTMTELSRLAGVSETTVVRFVYNLGYKGFPEFMAALRAELTAKQEQQEQPLMKTFNIEKGQYEFPQDTCRAVFSMEMQVMSDTLINMNNSDFQRAADMIFKAKEVLIVGCGANTCCTRALLFALQVLKLNVHAIEKLDITEESLIRSASKNAVCVAFTTPRYPSVTQNIIKIINKNNIPIIGISNSRLAPIFPYCEVFFQIPEKYVTYIDANASYMALIHALTFEIYQKDKIKARKQIEEYNSFARANNYYINGEVDLVELDTKYQEHPI